MSHGNFWENQTPEMNNRFLDGFNEPQKVRRIEPDILKPHVPFCFNNPHDMNKFLNSQLTSMKVDTQLQLERKDKEIVQLRSALNSVNERYSQEKSVFLEENSLLKKALQILDKKQKDSVTQITEQNILLGRATVYLEELERQNRNLQFHVEMLEKGGRIGGFNNNSGFDPPPPDIF